MRGKGRGGYGLKVCAMGWVVVACVVQGKKDCERDKNKKLDERKQNERSSKKMSWKKMKNFFHFARENRPTTTTKMALRASLWTTGTSGKALHDTSSNTFASI